MDLPNTVTAKLSSNDDFRQWLRNARPDETCGNCIAAFSESPNGLADGKTALEQMQQADARGPGGIQFQMLNKLGLAILTNVTAAQIVELLSKPVVMAVERDSPLEGPDVHFEDANEQRPGDRRKDQGHGGRA
jgi:hypothetical protein